MPRTSQRARALQDIDTAIECLIYADAYHPQKMKRMRMLRISRALGILRAFWWFEHPLPDSATTYLGIPVLRSIS